MSEDILVMPRIEFKYKIVTLFFLSVINIIFSFSFEPLVFLTENQILYLMSTLVQAIAGLFGLVLAAYAIIDPKLKAEGENCEDIKESLHIMRQGYYEDIKYLSTLCAFTILFGLLTLVWFEKVSDILLSVLLNETIVLGIISILSFLRFGCSILNPQTLSDINSRALEVANSEYVNADLELRPFIEYYNRLEKLILGYASELIEKDLVYKGKYNDGDGQTRMQIFQALNTLRVHGIINQDIYKKIDELRRYRNALVHSTEEVKVNSKVFSELKDIYIKLSDIYDSKEDVAIQKIKIQELYKYGKEVSLSEKDKEILRLIKGNPNITLSEMSQRFSCSRNTMKRRLVELCKKEKVYLKDGKYYVLVDEL